MKSKSLIYPALIAAAACLLLILYSLLAARHGLEHQPSGPFKNGGPAGSFRHEKDNLKEAFKFLGTIAVYAGALNFLWFYFKKKLKSPLSYIKIAGRYLHKFHTYIGWAGLIAAAVHGVYFLLKEFQDEHVLTGISSILILLTLAVYGWLFKKLRSKKLIRQIHFYLACLFLLVLLIHAGGTMFAAAAIIIGICVIVWFLDSRAQNRK
ncbi:hypothetical protein [Peribacillus kribbensis]|uniref:hypothetical protein n=1 Tax=Peribacillus kribbensis TaxID=356658 RepID=UPI0003F5C538|nr:hypothetical protein [Peribacillus kribbensis]